MSLIDYSKSRRNEALGILDELKLFERWGRYGRPVLVGAVAYDLVYDADIDMEVYCPELRIEDGFSVMRECCVESVGTLCAEFQNHLSDTDDALYWRLMYRAEDDTEWKIDMWSAREDYSLPRSETIVEPMRRALTDDTRRAILALKRARENDRTLACPSIDLYRAVLDDGVTDEESFRFWLENNEIGRLTGWLPGGDC